MTTCIDKNKVKIDVENIKVGDAIQTSTHSGFCSGSAGYGEADIVTEITDTTIVVGKDVYNKEDMCWQYNNLYYISCYFTPDAFCEETIEYIKLPVPMLTKEEREQRRNDYIQAYYNEMKDGIYNG